jgi:hypothetical protein
VFAAIFLLRNAWILIIGVGLLAIDVYLLCVRLRKKESRYPLVPPDGKGDIYFPRTNIPRPIHEDARKIREKKKKLEKLGKMRREKR